MDADRFEWGSCPDWCLTRHANWNIERGSHDGPRWPTIHSDYGTSVDIATVQNDDGDVVVWVDAEHGSLLTLEQARAAAPALLEAASWVDEAGSLGKVPNTKLEGRRPRSRTRRLELDNRHLGARAI